MGIPAEKTDKLARRLACLVALIQQGGDIDKHALAKQFGVHIRTVERDLAQRLAGVAERDGNGQWKLLASASHAVPVEHLDKYARLTGNAGLFPNGSPQWLIAQLEAADAGFDIHPVAQEDSRLHQALFERLQAAISQKRACTLAYKGRQRDIHPYRLLHHNGVWYLAAAEQPQDQLKIFSLARIEGLQIDEGKTFAPQKKHLAYLQGQQGVWFTPEAIKVVLRVSKEVAHYFRRRQLLPHQNTQESDGGNLVVTAQIHHQQEIMPFVRFWLPHVRILQPKQWDVEFLEELKNTLERWRST